VFFGSREVAQIALAGAPSCENGARP
jgi:hypothetical protein